MSDGSDCPYCGYPVSTVEDQLRATDRAKIAKLSDEVRELRVTVARLRGSLGATQRGDGGPG